MYLDENLKNMQNSLIEERNRLKSQIKEVDEQECNLCNFINRCASFDETIIFHISKLLTSKEKKLYVPFVYRKYKLASCYPRTACGDIFIGIAPFENIIEYNRSKNTKLDSFFNLRKGYSLFWLKNGELVDFDASCKDEIISYYNLHDCEKDKKTITFGFLLNNYGIRNSYADIYSRYSFDDYEYVQEYIGNLFNLQVQNNGRHLTSEEMEKALNDYLELENGKERILKQD